ncbi:lysosomal amino acid transporter 1 homolog isoform X2 [Cebus imitator]|uniref:lysosomal amino acid transporter 1 homolog isoform X2 n=1 Tax=Cebus imitator TaxID=2715852 RepID=UPI00189C1320|nr:lysosomal amino acid transporter 1 homolog isoform X2 [Cebus imitator]
MLWKKLGFRNFSSCPNGSIQWIWDVFGECAQDGWDEASVGLGLISILCFAASTFPPGDADAVLLLQVQETPLSVVCPHQLCAVVPHGDGVRHTATERHWAHGCPEGNLPGAGAPVRGARQQALYSAGNHWLRHRLGLQCVVPAVPAASDPHQLPPEVHPGDLLLTVCAGDAGEHAVRAECAAQKPGGGPEQGQLPAAPPALACGQPGCTAARHRHLHPVPGVQAQHPCLRARAPPPPQLTRAKLSTGEQGPSEATPGRERCGQ